VSLRNALKNITADHEWWRKLLLGGLLMLSVVGAPLAAGFVTLHYEQIRRGYPRALPPWVDLSGMYVLGLLTQLIELAFFVLPAGVALILVVVLSLTVGSAGPVLSQVVIGALGVWWLTAFALSLAPLGRLITADEGQVEVALSAVPLRLAVGPERGLIARARLSSLVVYLPAVLLAIAAYTVGAQLAVLPLLWLVCSAVFGAHLVVAQLYAGAPVSSHAR
jgi:Protein of unknown function (DUF4013)